MDNLARVSSTARRSVARAVCATRIKSASACTARSRSQPALGADTYSYFQVCRNVIRIAKWYRVQNADADEC